MMAILTSTIPQPTEQRRLGRPPRSLAQATAVFWSYIDQSGGPDACWPWTRTHNTLGYGVWSLQGHRHYTHRVAFFFTHGRWPISCALHHCDNPPCCNPAHIFEGTRTDNANDRNAKDRTAKGDANGSRKYPERRPRGEAHGRAKFAATLIREIRNAHGSSHIIAAHFGISARYIRQIRSRRVWKHLP